MEILNVWVKELIDEIDMPTAGVSDEDFIKSIFIKYNNGYGKITTSNAKKAIFNMVSHNNLSLIMRMYLSITMPTPTLTFEQFKNIIYSNNLDKLFKQGPGMGIYMPLEHREQIPRVDISWSKDKIFSCYENIIENKLKKLDWKICQGKLQMLGWVVFQLAAKRMIEVDHSWFSMTTHLGHNYSAAPMTELQVIEGWTWHKTALAMELDILSDENYTPCKEIYDSAYLRDPNWIETEAHLLGMDPETLRSRLLLSSSNRFPYEWFG
jgi:hypothetical protein